MLWSGFGIGLLREARFKPRPALTFWSHHLLCYQLAGQPNNLDPNDPFVRLQVHLGKDAEFMPGSAPNLQTCPRCYSVVPFLQARLQRDKVSCETSVQLRYSRSCWSHVERSSAVESRRAFQFIDSRSCHDPAPVWWTSQLQFPERADEVLALLVESSSATYMPFACVADEDRFLLDAARVSISTGLGSFN